MKVMTLLLIFYRGKSLKYNLNSNQLNRKGNCEGELIGGNLALIYALLGTKYSFDFKDKILFIEDIGENFYALDRMIMSMELAGVFNKISGLIIGGMTNMGDEKENKQYEESFDGFAYQLISDRISKYDFPVVFGFPNGHIKDNRPLIIGSEVSLKIGKTVSLNFKNNAFLLQIFTCIFPDSGRDFTFCETLFFHENNAGIYSFPFEDGLYKRTGRNFVWDSSSFSGNSEIGSLSLYFAFYCSFFLRISRWQESFIWLITSIFG